MTDTNAARNVRVDAFVAQMERTDRAALVRAIERETMAELERAGIAKRIKAARNEAGLSQPEMAEAVGVIPRTYQNYESLKDPRTPWGLMNDIARITGKSTEWLIHGERATPELLGALSSGEQVSGGFEEFRGYVRDLHTHMQTIEAKLEAARAERESMQELIATQNANLAEQSNLLRELRQVVAVLPAVREALALLQPAEDAGQSAEQLAREDEAAPDVVVERSRRTG